MKRLFPVDLSSYSFLSNIWNLLRSSLLRIWCFIIHVFFFRRLSLFLSNFSWRNSLAIEFPWSLVKMSIGNYQLRLPDLKFIINCNSLQNILKRITKSNEVREYRKNFNICLLRIFWTSVPKIYFCRRDRALGCVPMKFWYSVNISLFPNLNKVVWQLVRQPYIKWGYPHIKFLTLNIKFRCTCGEWNVY